MMRLWRFVEESTRLDKSPLQTNRETYIKVEIKNFVKQDVLSCIIAIKLLRHGPVKQDEEKWNWCLEKEMV